MGEKKETTGTTATRKAHGGLSIPVAAKEDEEKFRKASEYGDWIQRLNLLADMSKIVQAAKKDENSPYYRADGQFCFGTENELCGKRVVVLICGWREKAMHLKNGDSLVAMSFDPASEVYKKIQAEEKGDHPKGTSYSTGPDFLFWIPHLKKFATFYLKGSFKTGSSKFHPLIGKMCVLEAYWFEGGKNSWWKPRVRPLLGDDDAQEVKIPSRADPSKPESDVTVKVDAIPVPDQEEFDKVFGDFKDPKAPDVGEGKGSEDAEKKGDDEPER